MEKPESIKKYNKIYELLVEDDDSDIVGLLAYCFYKQSKQAYIKSYNDKHKCPPPDQEIQNHVEFSEIPALPYYKKKAEQTILILLDQAVEEKQTELELDFDLRFRTLLKRYKPENKVERLIAGSKGCLFNGLGGVVGNVMTTVIVIIFLFLIASSTNREGFLDGAKRNLVSGFARTLGVTMELTQSEQVQTPLIGKILAP